ncbi:LLM class flavin-dependent oxidoreductase [Burkholderia gladioli]|uniref:LLM class flavin-dependent oxidoreductase n=1 Tax=Burkholderia gladioli TaxID=28095 RepID=UPI002FDFB517
MSARWRLSLLTRVYVPSSDSRVLHETLALIEAAEALGYHGAWVAQHHFGRGTPHAAHRAGAAR